MRAGLAGVFRANKAGKFALVMGAAAAGVLALGALQLAQAAASTADVLKVRLGGDKAETRIVLDVNRSVSGKLVSDGAGDHQCKLPGFFGQKHPGQPRTHNLPQSHA